MGDIIFSNEQFSALLRQFGGGGAGGTSQNHRRMGWAEDSKGTVRLPNGRPVYQAIGFDSLNSRGVNIIAERKAQIDAANVSQRQWTDPIDVEAMSSDHGALMRGVAQANNRSMATIIANGGVPSFEQLKQSAAINTLVSTAGGGGAATSQGGSTGTGAAGSVVSAGLSILGAVKKSLTGASVAPPASAVPSPSAKLKSGTGVFVDGGKTELARRADDKGLLYGLPDLGAPDSQAMIGVGGEYTTAWRHQTDPNELDVGEFRATDRFGFTTGALNADAVVSALDNNPSRGDRLASGGYYLGRRG